MDFFFNFYVSDLSSTSVRALAVEGPHAPEQARGKPEARRRSGQLREQSDGRPTTGKETTGDPQPGIAWANINHVCDEVLK